MDIMVIGGGVMGMTCAWQLAKNGADVALFDEGKLGRQASAAALGALWPSSMLRPGPLQRLHMQSLWSYPAFIEALVNDAQMPVEYARRGKLEIIKTERQLTNSIAEAQHACEAWPPFTLAPGQPYCTAATMEVLDVAAARALEPAIDVGTFGVQVCNRSAQVQVSQLLAALAAACRRAGVKVFEDRRLEKIEVAAGGLRVDCGGGRYEPGKVLLCGGNGIPMISPELASLAPIKPVKGQALLLATDRPIISHIIKNGAVFLVPWHDGRILVGSTTEPDAGFDTSNTAQGIEFLTAGAIATCPPLAQARIESIWAGLRPTGPHHQPLMGPLADMPGVYVCAGHYKVGIGMAPMAGQLMVNWLMNQRVPEDAMEFIPRPAARG